MSKNNSKTFPLGRDSKTGQFIPVREANRRPNSVTIERIPKSGKGDTSRELKSIIIKSYRRK
jgi:hypothetical protein